MALASPAHLCYAPRVRDPYAVLGLERNASAEDVKRAFRRLAREHHPDCNPDNPQAHERFQELNAAYQVLSDPERRARYDRLGDIGSGAPSAGPGGVALDELLGELFGAFTRRPSRSGDMRHVVELTFEQAALGCQKRVSYTRVDVCSECRGSCAAPGSAVEACRDCGGRGRVAVVANGWLAVKAERPCPRCQGSGRVPKVRCPGCGGNGLQPQTRELDITIPAGIEAGASQLIAQGGSRLLPTDRPGDLEIVIQVQAHARFRRDGDDVFADVDVPYVTAALGGELEVETLHGPQRIRVPEGTLADAEVRLRGQGVPHRFRSGAGDHVARVKLRVPGQLSQRARELITQFEEAVGSYEDASLLGKLRGFLFGDG